MTCLGLFTSVVLVLLLSVAVTTNAFVVPNSFHPKAYRLDSRFGHHADENVIHVRGRVSVQAAASEGGGGGKKKKKRRRRKQQPSDITTTDTTTESVESSSSAAAASSSSSAVPPAPPTQKEMFADDVIRRMARQEGIKGGVRGDEEEEEDDEPEETRFTFSAEDMKKIGFDDDDVAVITEEKSSSVIIPDFKELMKQKEKEEEEARLEKERKEKKKPLVKRSDTKAVQKLLQLDPYADEDDSLFEKEEYGAVSALLGEGAKPFLGIPSGPLQVGHFIGALGIILMAFIEYPGFPLTNLPTPLRSCLQTGLGTIYAINTVLAVFAVFKAGERGQSAGLWALKTFSVGGLAYDQLTQLPTLEQVEEEKTRKGARAQKKKGRR